MNDFETARKLACQVEDPAGPSLPCGECAGCLALDRIETVVERLRSENLSLHTVIAAMQDDLNNSTPNGEVERLRMTQGGMEFTARLAELEAEVKRLRAALERALEDLAELQAAPVTQVTIRAALAKEEA